MRVDVYDRILVDAKVPWGLLKAPLRRLYQRHIDEGWWGEGGVVEEKEVPGTASRRRGLNGLSTSGLLRQNICKTSGKIDGNLRGALLSFWLFFSTLLLNVLLFFLLFSSHPSCRGLAEFYSGSQIGPMWPTPLCAGPGLIKWLRRERAAGFAPRPRPWAKHSPS